MDTTPQSEKFLYRLDYKPIFAYKVYFMSGLKTCLASLVALVLAFPAWATPDRTEDRALVFAECLGRFSAQREHGWLIGGAEDMTEDYYGFFSELLEAVSPAAREAGLSDAAIMHHRITAKIAQARLLSASAFDHDPQRRMRAGVMARRQLAGCETLLLS